GTFTSFTPLEATRLCAVKGSALSGSTCATSRPQLPAVNFNLPLSFEANDGQTDGQVKFLSRRDGYTVFLTSNGVVLDLHKPVKSKARQKPLVADLFAGYDRPEAPKPVVHAVVGMTLVGADPYAQAAGLKELRGKANYFIGNDPNKWHTNVRTYAEVHYR